MRASTVPSRSAIWVSPVMIVFQGMPGMAGVPLWTGPTCQAMAVGAPTRRARLRVVSAAHSR